MEYNEHWPNPTTMQAAQPSPSEVMDNCPVAPVLTVRAARVSINWCEGEFLLECLNDICPNARGMPVSWKERAAGSPAIN